MQGPKLISTGRATVDARDIVAVIEIDESDWHKTLESGEKIDFPSYARSQVFTKYGGFVADAPADVIVTRWRQALGGLPEPIGAED